MKTESLPKTLSPFFWYFIKPYKWCMLGMLCTGLYWGIFTSLSPYLLKLIIDGIAEFQGDKAQVFSAIEPYVWGYVAAWIVVVINFRTLDWIILRMIPAVRRDIVNRMFAYLNRHSFNYFQNNFAGSLSNKISDMTSGVASIIQKVDDGYAQFMGVLIAFPMMFLVHPIFAIILLIWIISFALTTVYFTKNIESLSNVFSVSKTTLVGKIVDSIGNVSSMRLFSRNSYENKIIRKGVDDTVSKDRAMQWYVLKMHIAWDVSILSLMFIMLYTLIVMYSKGLVTIGDFAFIITLSMSIFHNLWWLAGQYAQFAEEVGRCSQALTIITAPHEIVDAPKAKKLRVKKGEIEFKDVTFNYTKGRNIFENKSVIIKPGQKVGLVGFSGSGKTTFANLILRFFDIESGKILIDGQSIAEVTQDSLRGNISMIPQDASLFHRSLMENIRYGDVDASDKQVIAASKKAHCHEFIKDILEGYEALVGERGIKLSGGQRQRVAIARAMLKNAPILILDEATSALDSVTEKYIQDGLNSLMKGRTTIVIAHRLSTLSEMDRILVFDNGHIIEDGTHKELLKNKGRYAKMWKMQAGGFLPESEGA